MADDRYNGNVIEIIGGDGLEGEMDQSMKIGKIPFKTHSSEEIQIARPDWKEIVAADEERASLVEPREEFPIPSLDSSGFIAETERPYRGRHCKLFYSKWGCHYGDGCPYVHDEEAKGRERDAIILGPGSRVRYWDRGATRNGGGPAPPPPLAPPPPPPLAPPPLAPPQLEPPPLAPPTINSTLRPLNWKTRICNKWEKDGFCPFGSRCLFAHGAAELQPYGGGLVNEDGNNNKQVVATPGPSAAQGIAPAVHSVAPPGPSVANAGGFEQPQGAAQRPRGKWKGPNKISLIYGDWIEELE